VRVTADLESDLSRGLWLVKWVLAIPHYLILFALWIGFAVSSILAFFAILFTRRFPRALFDFNVGVMRWTWRVTCYAFGALSTDRYPPFSLSNVEDYPAHFDVDYPEQLSRGLVLVKWWLLALPHYFVVAFFVSGGLFAAGQASEQPPFVLGGGLIGLLVLVAGVVLLFRGQYPRGVFDLVVGLQRWVLRVTAYAALMTDAYPPFRLDMGGAEPSEGVELSGGNDRNAESPSDAQHGAMGTGATIAGAVMLVLATILAVVAAGLWAAKEALPDDDGFFTTPTASCKVATYAITSAPLVLHVDDMGSMTPASMLGDARVSVASRDESEIFVGVASTSSVETYLDGVAHTTMAPENAFGDRHLAVCAASGGHAPAARPASLPIWTTYSQGQGEHIISWPFEEGDWTVVIMRADATRGLDVKVNAAATIPAIGLALPTLLIVAGVLLLFGLSLLVGSRSTPADDATSTPTT
jgi:hypothetical protein